MITLDQVLLLEKKVESAVARIEQLQAENDALHKKCAELTNALSSKSEQLSSFESNQDQIESGILNALDRLNQIENSVLKVAGQVNSSHQVQNEYISAAPSSAEIIPESKPLIQKDISQNTEPVLQHTQTEHKSFTIENPFQIVQKNDVPPVLENETPSYTNIPFDSMENVVMNNEPEEDFDNQDESQDNLGFDIF